MHQYLGKPLYTYRHVHTHTHTGTSLFGPEQAAALEKYLIKTLGTDIANVIVAGKHENRDAE
jgi:hypothetical protein